MDFDDVLLEFGEFGTYQKMIIYLVLLPAVIPCGFHAYNQIFMSAKPRHWCRVPESEQNLTFDSAKNLSTPPKTAGGTKVYDECFFYDKNFSSGMGTGISDYQNKAKVPCEEGWTYDTSKYLSTIVTEVIWDYGGGECDACDTDSVKLIKNFQRKRQ